MNLNPIAKSYKMHLDYNLGWLWCDPLTPSLPPLDVRRLFRADNDDDGDDGVDVADVAVIKELWTDLFEAVVWLCICLSFNLKPIAVR